MERKNGKVILTDDSGISTRLPAGAEVVEVTKVGRLPARGQLRVLIAEDCRDTADSLAMLVKLWGHDVRVTYSGKAALEMAAAYQADILLLDVGMPGMTGFQLARQLHLQARFQHTLFIAVTGWADLVNRLIGEGAGFDHYLIKPVDPATLEALLLLEKARLTHRDASDSARRVLLLKHAHTAVVSGSASLNGVGTDEGHSVQTAVWEQGVHHVSFEH